MVQSSLWSRLVTTSFCILNIISMSYSYSPGDIRLVRPSTNTTSISGRVEIFHNGVWGTVCDDGWSINGGNVVCRQLGYQNAVSVYSRAYFGSGSGHIWMDGIVCNGTESRLSDCSFNGWGINDCSHTEDAGVACQTHTTYSNGSLLVNGGCAFESGPNLCGYQNLAYDTFDWTLHTGGTFSSNTGPRHDHTSGYGHYIYIESSSPRVLGDKARIISPQITGRNCLKFFYHMKGLNIGELNVYVKYGNKESLIWQSVGEQASVWILAQIPIYGVSTFRILFEGVVGSSYQGDIALDDIKLLNETCVPVDSGNCTFEASFCGYANDMDDDFNWNIHSGATSYITGPRNDHTTGTGNYIYIKTSSPRIPGEEARIVSPEIFGAKCVQFYYHMRGSSIGELNVYIDNGISKVLVWQLNGEQSTTWNKGMVPVKNLRSFKVIFEGVAGSDYRGNIALDDISVLDRVCVSVPANAEATPINITSIIHTVRLMGGNASSAGRIEVLHNGRWGTVCGTNFPLSSGRVVCRQLGFLDVELVSTCCSLFPAGKGRILLEDVRCRGDEPAITMCSHKGWGISRCSHNQDIGVICKTNNSLGNTVRINGSSNDFEGRVEVQIGGIWGTVSDLGWDIFDANVLCRQIGFSGATGVYNGAHFGMGSGPVWITNAECNGNETTLWNCKLKLNRNPRRHTSWSWSPNPHRRDAGAECYDLRLTGGKKGIKSEGIIEIKYLGTWGTICNDGWDINDAKVVCRQMGYSRAVSLRLGYSANISAGVNPVITRLRCSGREISIGLCAHLPLFSITHHCTHEKDAQVVCADPVPTTVPTTVRMRVTTKVPTTVPTTMRTHLPTIPTTVPTTIRTHIPTTVSNHSKHCHAKCPNCQKTATFGAICVCSLEHTDVIYPWCDATIGVDVIEVQLLNGTLNQWNVKKFQTSLADQLNVYCSKNNSCSSQSLFDANDIVILDGYPKASNGHILVLRFMVLELYSNSDERAVHVHVIQNMIKQYHNLAGYEVKFTENVKPLAHARKELSSKQLKLFIPISVVVVIGIIALIFFIIFRNKKYRKRRSVVRYWHAPTSDAGNNDNDGYHDDNDGDDDLLLELNNDDQAPLLSTT